jgi:acetyl esterase
LRVAAPARYVTRVTWLSDLAERAQGTIASGVLRLPSPLLRLLAGGGPVRIDGLELDADVQLALRLLTLGGQHPLADLGPVRAREEMARDARIFAGWPPAMGGIEPRVIPGPAGPIPARLYVPRDGAPPRPLGGYYHGGGWVVGDLDTHDATCRHLAHATTAAVLSVAYRLAPEHRFPAAVDDALAAFAWAVREAPSLGADPARVAVAGDSAGGNLAAVVAQQTARADGPRPKAQLLIYPVTDLSTKHPSYRLFGKSFFLTEADMDWYRGEYLPDEAAARDPRASPLLAPDLSGLPPAIVLTAGFDVLRDEGEAYARRLHDAGVPVELRRNAGQIHGFANASSVSPTARATMDEAARLFRTLLA